METIERVFQVKMKNYRRKTDLNVQYIRAEQDYSIPEEIQDDIDSIPNLYHLPTWSKKQMTLMDDDIILSNDAMDMKKKINFKVDFPTVLSPTTWRGEVVTIMAALRCSNGEFRTMRNRCRLPIQNVMVSIDPLPEKLETTVVAFKKYVLFDRPEPLCKPCSSYPPGQYIRGQETHVLCQNILKTYPKAKQDTLFCILTVSGAHLATPSAINVATVFADPKQEHPIVSEESQCLAGVSRENCSKIVYLMPDITPSYLHNLYSIPSDLKGGHPRNQQAVGAFLHENYSEPDLQLFLQHFNVTPKHAVSQVMGPNDPSRPSGEATLDVQTMMGIAPNISTVFWSVGGLRKKDEAQSSSNQEVRTHHNLVIH